MLNSFWAIAKSAFVEIVRQPIYAILVVCGLVLIAFSPLITMFTMMDDIKLTVDMGLGTIFMVGLILSVLSATQVISREIDSKTAGAVISKPVGRFIFVAGKFLGVTMAMLLASYLLCLMLFMTIRMGVPSTAAFRIDWPVLLSQIIPFLFAILVGLYANFFYRWNFPATAVQSAVVLYTLAMIALLFIGKNWEFELIGQTFMERGIYPILLASVLVFLGVWVMSSIALAASTRANVVANVLICTSIFFVGMISQYLFGWAVGLENLGWTPAKGEETVVLKGTVLTSAGRPLPDVKLSGAPDEVSTTEDGSFQAIVKQGGSGELTPKKWGYRFDPASRKYENIQKSRAGEDFAAIEASYSWTGYLRMGWKGTAWLAYHVVPSLQTFWVGDQLMRPSPYIPLAYVGKASGYAVTWCMAMVFLGAFLFEKREVI